LRCCSTSRGYGLWALEVGQTGEFIGFTGLNPMPDGVPGAGGVEVGWRLARHTWHHGYATEAARAALAVAFDGIGLNEIWSMTAVLNEPSQGLGRQLPVDAAVLDQRPGLPDDLLPRNQNSPALASGRCTRS
jgi:RimJ/RimL family protein N-acetyltransferase